MMELIKALAAAKLEFKPIQKDAKNSIFSSKYATLDSLIDATQEALSANGLVVVHSTDNEKDLIIMTTTLYHESGDFIESRAVIEPPPPIVSKQGGRVTNELQSLGIALTYNRRYQYAMILGLAGEVDNDGNGQNQIPNRKDIKNAADKANQTKLDPEQQKADEKMAEMLKKKRQRLHILETQKGLNPKQIKDGLKKYFKVGDMKKLTLKQLQELERKYNALPDKPKDGITAAHKELVESIAKAVGFKYADVLEYIQSLEKDWEDIDKLSAKWIGDDTEREKFVSALSGYMADKSQGEIDTSAGSHFSG